MQKRRKCLYFSLNLRYYGIASFAMEMNHGIAGRTYSNRLEARLDVFTALKIQVAFFCFVTPCGILSHYLHCVTTQKDASWNDRLNYIFVEQLRVLAFRFWVHWHVFGNDRVWLLCAWERLNYSGSLKDSSPFNCSISMHWTVLSCNNKDPFLWVLLLCEGLTLCWFTSLLVWGKTTPLH